MSNNSLSPSDLGMLILIGSQKDEIAEIGNEL